MSEEGEEAVETGKRRCRAVIDGIESLLSLSKITISCKQTLLRLAHSDLSFLSRLSSNPNHNPPLSINIGHLEAVLYILQQPFVYGVSRVCKPIPLSPAFDNARKTSSSSKGIHVDIVCTLNGIPVWFVVSDRNPKYVSWYAGFGNKGLQTRIKQVIDAAQSSLVVGPSSIILFFSNGLDDAIREKLEVEFGASKFEMEFSNSAFGFSEELEGDWVNLHMRSFQHSCILEIKVDSASNNTSRDSLLAAAKQQPLQEQIDSDLGSSFRSLVSSLELWSWDVKSAQSSQSEHTSREANLVNFDTTALIALVSGISNGSTEKLLAAPESELRRRFKGNFEFVMAQVMTEIQSLIHVKLGAVISGKRGIICESVYSEFNELVSMCGGPNEKLRRDHLLNHLIVMPDSPSARMMSLPTTRKLALKNKVVFGTGDYWQAPTLTANMAFVRAVSQTGMSLFTIEHEPRALTGD